MTTATTAALVAALAPSPAWLGAALLGPAAALILAMSVSLPVISQLPLPGLAKNGRTLRGALAMTTALAISPQLSGTAFSVPAVAHCAMTGLLLGLLVRLVWETVLVTAALLDVTLGRGSIGIQGLSESDSNGPFTSLAGLLYLSIFFVSGIHLDALGGLAEAAVIAGDGGWVHAATDIQGLVADTLYLFSNLFRAATAVALPALLVALLVDLTLGWANRTLRSLPAMFLAMPLRAMLGWLLVPATLLGAGAVLADVLTRTT